MKEAIVYKDKTKCTVCYYICPNDLVILDEDNEVIKNFISVESKNCPHNKPLYLTPSSLRIGQKSSVRK